MLSFCSMLKNIGRFGVFLWACPSAALRVGLSAVSRPCCAGRGCRLHPSRTLGCGSTTVKLYAALHTTPTLYYAF